MADHVRKRIRAAVATLLTGLATTGANVFASRLSPLQDDELPALVIMTPSEDAQATTISNPSTVERALTLNVYGFVKEADGYEDTVDQIAKEVETALAGDPTLGNLCEFVELQRTQTELSEDAELGIAKTTMTFSVRYYTLSNAPDISL